MQVKRRINRFFGIILRKDKSDQSVDEKESSPKGRKKWNNQSYSQWDLMENIGVDPDQARESKTNKDENKMIYSDGLALDSLHPNSSESENDVHLIEESTQNKRKSFLRRSGSFLRRSLSRKSKKEKVNQNSQSHSPLSFNNEHDEDLTIIVKEINETLLAVATFGEATLGHNPGPSTSQSDKTMKIDPTTTQSNSMPSEISHTALFIDQEETCLQSKMTKKVGLAKGLKRQASKLASKFQRNNKNGSLRLKSATSLDSFPTMKLSRQSRSASASNVHNEKLYESGGVSRVGSLRRRISFKKARKVVRKGVSSVGKSMIHASSVMPMTSYQYPPASFYPEHNYYDEDEYYPNELQRYYYRTHSYLPKEQQQQHNGYKPTSFYQHGYCYNG